MANLEDPNGVPAPEVDPQDDPAVVGEMFNQQPDWFVREAIQNIPDPEEVLVFAGFLGRGPADDNSLWRLYFTLQLKEYVEFRGLDVIAHQKPERVFSRFELEDDATDAPPTPPATPPATPGTPPAEIPVTKFTKRTAVYRNPNPLGGHIIWLRKDALLRFEPPSLRQQASFLSGVIATNLLQQMGGLGGLSGLAGLGRLAGENPDSDLGCTTLPLCQS
ncbi:MAG TPA: hypothetical protein VGE04_04735 [Chloroflexia bacterium]